MNYARTLGAWIYTALVAAAACLVALFSPRLTWVVFAPLWGKIVLRIAGIRYHVQGHENLKGPAVFIANHQSMVDVAILPAIQPPTTKFIAKQELAKIPLWGWALARSGGLMINRKDPRGAVAAINDGLEKMPNHWSVAVFPEGTRSPDGRLGRFKKGAFRIALLRRLPMVPIGIAGTQFSIPKHSCWIRPTTVWITVGEPVQTDKWKNETLDAHVADMHERVANCHRAAKQKWQEGQLSQPSIEETVNKAEHGDEINKEMSL